MIIEDHADFCTKEALDNYTGHFPAGGSFKQVDHYRQIMLTKEFKMYDYNFQHSETRYRDENMQRYGTSTPPFYPTENIQALPIVLVCGKGDKLCQPGDYLLLKE